MKPNVRIKGYTDAWKRVFLQWQQNGIMRRIFR